MPEIQLIATGSSSFALANSVNEPLTGRKWEYKLFPLSFGEMALQLGSEISYNNLASLLSMDNETVVIFRFPAYSRNHRKELKRGRPFLSKSFSNTYPDHTFSFINPENFTEFINGEA